MKIVGHILAVIGFVCVVKHIMHYKEGCCLCGWHKTKTEEEKPEYKKPSGSTVSHKIKVEEERRQGSRYGSNPIRY